MSEMKAKPSAPFAALRAAEARERVARMAESVKIDRKIAGLMDAIDDGAWSPALQERLAALESH